METTGCRELVTNQVVPRGPYYYATKNRSTISNTYSDVSGYLGLHAGGRLISQDTQKSIADIVENLCCSIPFLLVCYGYTFKTLDAKF